MLGRKKRIQKKYKVSLCSIFKNEACYLKEWINFHVLIGIEHFYLYNNFSEDNYYEVLKPFIEDGIVTLIDWPVHQGQCSAYIDCIAKHKNESEWIGFIDLDEFIVLNSYEDIYSFLLQFQEKYPTVVIYWKIFGSSGFVDRDRKQLVTESFYLAWRKHSDIGKYFFNTLYDFDSNFKYNKIIVHTMWGKKGFMNVPPVDCFYNILVGTVHPKGKPVFPIQINHYFTKSLNEYIEKSRRGDAVFKTNPRDMEYFYEHDNPSTVPDYSAYKYLKKLKGINDEKY